MVQTFALKSALSEAIALINAGQIDKTEAICRALLKSQSILSFMKNA